MGGRGRGRGAGSKTGGRRGKGGSRGRGASRNQRNSVSFDNEQNEVGNQNLDINTDAKAFFLGVASCDAHRKAQETNRAKYAASILLFIKQGVILSANSKVRALAAAWSRQDYELADSLLQLRDSFTLVEVNKALQLLDSGRQMRSMQKRLEKLESQAEAKGIKLRKNTVQKLKTNIDNLTKLKPEVGSVSGALCKHIRKWVRQFTKAELEFFALHYPKEPWKYLSDICHLHPEKDFPQLPWFLPYCYGAAKPPEESVVHQAQNVTDDNINDILTTQFIPFTHVRQNQKQLTNQSKANIAKGDAAVERALWWYEELSCKEVDDVILNRLKAGEAVNMNYGKLMERLLKLKMLGDECPDFFKLLIPIADEKLSSIKLKLEPPVVVIADASSSMDVAINTATIIASILTVCSTAKLIFFNENFWFATKNPTCTEDVLELASTTKAESCTAHAAGLWPFYEKKEVVKTFIIVTDEEENTNYENHQFQDLFALYQKEVYNSRLVFISFLSYQTAEGQMCSKLRKVPGLNLVQFKMDRNRPDLSRLDNILGQLSLDSTMLESELEEQENLINQGGLRNIFQQFCATNSSNPSA